MANKKINELLSRTPSLSDLMLVGDPSSGYSYKCTVTALATIIETDIADGYVTLATAQTISGAKTFSNVLTLTSVANSSVDTDKFLVLTGTNTVNYRTGAEVLSDIGGASSSSISGTTNYVAKFTSSSAIGNSLIFDNGTNVGISTTSPSYKLDVSGSLRSTTSSYFATGGGNIGIGTTGVTGIGGPILQIHASTYPEIHLTNSTTGDQYQDGTSIHVSGSSLNILNYESGSINLSTSGTQRVSIASDGNVTLSVIANATTDTDKFLVSDSGVIKYRTGAELLSDIGGASSSSVSGTTNYIPKFTSSSAIGNSQVFDNGTNVLIGTNSTGTYIPTTRLGILASSAAAAIGIYGRALDNEQRIDFQNNDGSARIMGITAGNTQANVFVDSNIPLIFSTNAAERMRLDASGNLGINTSSPSYKLDVTGSGRFTGNLGINGVGPTYPLYVRTGTNQRFRIVDGGSGYTQLASLDDAESAYTPIMIGNSWVNINASGNLGLGVSPSAWYNTERALQFNTGSIYTSSSPNSIIGIGQNYYYDGNDKYYANGKAALYNLINGGFQWYTAGTGTANGTITFSQRMTLNNDGNLGLGVTPSAWASGYTALQVKNASIYGFSSYETAYSVNAYYDGSWKYISSINASRYDQVLGSHIWYNAPSGTAGNAISFTQAMTLDASGRLAVGTSTFPTQNSGSLAGTAIFNGIVRISGSSTRYFTTGNGLELAVGSIYSYNRDLGAYNDLSINDAMTVKGAGNVGIGTTSPTGLLHLYGTDPAFRIQNSGTGNMQFGQWDGSNNKIQSSGRDFSLWGTDGYATIFGTNNTERMRITSGGQVGIGTSNPNVYGIGFTNQFTVSTTSGYANITVAGSSGNSGGIDFGNQTVRHAGIYGLDGSNLGFYTNGSNSGNGLTERMRITSGGNVGIGTSTPGAKLEVNGASATLIIADNTSYAAGVGGKLSLHGNYRAVGDITEAGYIKASKSNSTNGDYGFDMIFATSNYTAGVAERMRITSGGELLINTTSDAGDYKLQVNGASYMNNLVINRGGGSWDITPNNATNFLYFRELTGSAYPLTLDGTNVRVGINTTTPTATLEVNGSIKTAAPSGGTAGAWKLGTTETFSCTPGGGGNGFSTTVVRIDIGGTAYFIPTVTDGWC